MTIPRHARATLATALFLTACAEPSTPAIQRDALACPRRAGEWTQFGCARIVVLLTRPDGTPAVGVNLSMRLTPPPPLFPVVYALPTDRNGETRIHLDWEIPDFPAESPLLVRAIRLDPAADSVHRLDSLFVTARSVAAGERAQTDTLRWVLGRW